MTTYDPTLSDEEWRRRNFSQVAIASSRVNGARQPTVKELVAAAEKYGTEGICESAIHLTQSEYRRVEEAVTRLEKKR